MLTGSCGSIDKHEDETINTVEEKTDSKELSQKVSFELHPNKTKMVYGDSLELKLSLRIDDSIVFAEYIYSYDDTLETIDWPEDRWKPTTKYSLWLSGAPGNHVVKGKTEIKLIDTTFWKKWEFEFEITEQ